MPSNPTANMIAVLTLMLDGDNKAAASYLSGLEPGDAYQLAGVCCANIVELIRDTAREEGVPAEVLLRAVALRAARAAA